MMKKAVVSGFVMGILLFAALCRGVADDTISINGFGGWAYGRTDNDYRYLVGNGDGSYDHVDMALNIAIQSNDQLSFHVQTSYQERFSESEVQLEFCFAEFYVSDVISLRIGKIKAAHMLYTEIYNVGTLRPFFTLPQGLYHDFAAEAYKGIGLTGILFNRSGWEISYDLYAGKVSTQPYRIAFVVGSDDDPEEYEAIYGSMYWSSRDTFGSRFSVNTPLDGLSFGVSAFTGLVDLHIEVLHLSIQERLCQRFSFIGFSGEYLNETWLVRSEYLFNTQGDVRFEAGYLEIARRVMKQFQLAARYEYEIEKDTANHDFFENTTSESSQLRHRDLALGLNYWFNEAVVLKISWHMVEGNRFSSPEEIDEFVEATITDRFKERTNLLLIGLQFSF